MFLFVWLFAFVVKLVVAVTGIVMVPVAFFYRRTKLENLPFWILPWANPEDWNGGVRGFDYVCMPEEFVDLYGQWFWGFFFYHAIRNPADGLRNYSLFTATIAPDEIRYWTNKYLDHYGFWKHPDPKFRWFFVKMGVYACFEVQYRWNKTHFFQVRIGYRIFPGDAHGLADKNGTRWNYGADFSNKLLVYARI